MRDHEPGIEVVVDGDRAERRLRERAGEDDPGEDLRAAAEAGRPQRADRERERRQHGEERDDAVRELDVGVEAARRERVAGLAAGPVLAAEAGAGEPHRRARGDDQHEHRNRGDGEPPEAPGRENERATPRQRLRNRLGGHCASLARAANLTLT